MVILLLIGINKVTHIWMSHTSRFTSSHLFTVVLCLSNTLSFSSEFGWPSAITPGVRWYSFLWFKVPFSSGITSTVGSFDSDWIIRFSVHQVIQVTRAANVFKELFNIEYFSYLFGDKFQKVSVASSIVHLTGHYMSMSRSMFMEILSQCRSVIC